MKININGHTRDMTDEEIKQAQRDYARQMAEYVRRKE